MAASEPVNAAMRLLTASCNSFSRTNDFEAKLIASITSGRMSDALNVVYVPAPLMNGFTPSS